MSVVINRIGGELVAYVRGTGATGHDTASWQQAVAALNKAGGGRLLFDGPVHLNAATIFTTPVSLRGLSDQAILQMEITAAGNQIQWGNAIAPASLPNQFAFSATAGAETFSAPSATLSDGQWVLLWSEDQLLGLRPHFGPGAGQHGMELHMVQFWSEANKTAYVDGKIIDTFTTAGLATGAPVTLMRGVRVENVRARHNLATDPADYAGFMRFYGCYAPYLRNVHVLREGSGAIWFSFCAAIDARVQVDGAKKADLTYGVEVDCTEGGEIYGVIRGTRHPFTTTSSMAVDTSHVVSAVDDAADTLSFAAAHGLLAGQHVHLTTTGTLPAPLQIKTDYWIESVPTTTSLKLKSSVSGSAIDLTTTGSGTHTVKRQSRWGTPKNLVTRGQCYVSSKVTTGPTESSRIGWDTHAEGANIVCEMDIIMSGKTTNTGANSESRHTIFRKMMIDGGGTGATGIKVGATGCRVQDCEFRNLWRGVKIEEVIVGETYPFSNCHVLRNHFQDLTGYAVLIGRGDNHVVRGNTMINCGQVIGNSPFQNRSVVFCTADGTGYRIVANTIPKFSNDWSIDPGQLSETALRIHSNNLVGYGLSQTVSSVSAAADTLSFGSTQHYLLDNLVVYLKTAGTMPGGLFAGVPYFVIVSDSTTIQLATRHGGPAVDITSSGSGALTVHSGAMGIGRRRTVSSIDTGTDTITTTNSHGMTAGQIVRFSTTGSFGGGISPDTDYYVIVVSTTQLKIETSPGAGAVDLTGSFSGTMSLETPRRRAIEAAFVLHNTVAP